MKKWYIGLLSALFTIFLCAFSLSSCSVEKDVYVPGVSSDDEPPFFELNDPNVDYDENIKNFSFRFDEETGGYAFYYYRGEADYVKIPSYYAGDEGEYPVTKIADKVFSTNKTIKAFIIPDTVKRISASAFEGLDKITVVEVPDSVTSIGAGAFYGCWSLRKISLPFVGESADCSYSNSYFGYIFANRAKEEGRGETYEYEPDRFIYENETYVPGTLTDIIINGGAKIEEYAFACIRSAKRYSLPDTLEVINRNAFFWNEGVKKLTLPDGLLRVGVSAFNGCSHLEEMTMPFVGGDRNDYSGFIGYVFGAEKFTENLNYMPSTLLKVTLTKQKVLKKGAFYGLKGLKKIVLPDDCEHIEDGAFDGCVSLELNEKDGVYYIGNGNNPYLIAMNADGDIKSAVVTEGCLGIHKATFSECYSLESVSLPDSLEIIGEKAFYRAKKLKSVSIPKAVEVIGDGAFYDATSLEIVDVPDGSNVGSIGKYAFYNCTSLKEINLSRGIKKIGYCAFLSTFNLKTVRIEELSSYMNCEIENVAASPFASATELYVQGTLTRELTPPAVATSIKKYQFAGLKAVDKIILPSYVDRVELWAFYGMTDGQEVVFEGTTSDYKLESEWNYGCYATVSFAD